jgi:hypothetical protein
MNAYSEGRGREGAQKRDLRSKKTKPLVKCTE